MNTTGSKYTTRRSSNQKQEQPAQQTAPMREIPASVVREAFRQHQTGTLHDFEPGEQQIKVAHYSVPGFLRQVSSHRWHLEDIQRFGTVVGKTADAVQCAYVTACDAALGNIRVFPLPLLLRVYEILAPERNWPLLSPAELALDDPRRPLSDLVKAHQRTAKHLRAMMAATKNMDVQHSMALVLQWLDQEIQRSEAEVKEGATAESPIVAEDAADMRRE